MLSIFPRDDLDEIWDLIESVPESFPIYSYAGSLQEAIADTWREKSSNVNVAMCDINISV